MERVRESGRVMTKIWNKYWYVCTNCDSSLEVTSNQAGHEPACGCGNSHIILAQSERGEEQMNTCEMCENEFDPTISDGTKYCDSCRDDYKGEE